MNLKPQDILVLLKLVALGKNPWSFNKLAIELGMSPSEVHAAIKRALVARLAIRMDVRIQPHSRNLEEFLFHGMPYVFVPERGGFCPGMPTAHAALPLIDFYVQEDEPLPVWPDPDGEVQGESFSPLYKSAPFAARNDPGLYELLALADILRGGHQAEREIAQKEMKKRLTEGKRGENTPLVSDDDRLVIAGNLVVPRANLNRLAKRYHIKRLALFGSAARGELGPDSDIDLLAEFKKGKAPSLGGMLKIQEAFARLFNGRRVDLATSSILNNPYRRRTIEHELEELYAA